MKTKEILDDMRRITMLTGEISSVHVKSLKTWPFVVFDNVESAEISYDLTKSVTQGEGEGFATFSVKTSDTKEGFLQQMNFDKRCETLATYVRDMLWKEIKIEILCNDHIVYSNSSLKEVKDGSK